MSFKTAKYLPADHPEARAMQLRHLEGFTARRLAEARQKREQAEQAQEEKKQAENAKAQALEKGDRELAKTIAGKYDQVLK